MDTRYRPPRIFGDNSILIPFDFVPAIGTDIIRKFKLKPIDAETILFFDQLKLNPGRLRSEEAQIVLTDIRVVYVLVNSNLFILKKIIRHTHQSILIK